MVEQVGFLTMVEQGVQEIYSKNLTLLRWSGAHWRKLFSTGENEKIQMMKIKAPVE